MEKSQYKNQMRVQRHKRLRHKVSGTALRPRLSVFRSNTTLYAQLIDDTAGKTLASADSRKITQGTPLQKAHQLGLDIAEKAKLVAITEVVFDRGGFRYQGNVAKLAEGAREGGLKF
jgi:large subunit ribosomal protein L18